MTTYRERHLAGHYTTTQKPATDDEPTTTTAPTLAELKEQAEELGLPTYGTKAEIQARIDEAS